MDILITGANGQLATCIKDCISKRNVKYNYIFLDRTELDITKLDNIESVFENNDIGVVVNCAAYTNVDDAINNVELAYKINADGPLNLAICSRTYGAKMIHISTDFVFNGDTHKPYTPSDQPIALNIYGDSKLAGENNIKVYDNTLIIRTSWLYSEYGKNFFKTMYNRIKNRQISKVINDQIGTPTYARDLANFIIDLIDGDNIPHGILHYSNQGCCSWYDFAKTIEIEYNRFDGGEFIDSNLIHPVSSYDYMMKYSTNNLLPTRPAYSVLSKESTEKLIQKPIRHWLEAMNECYIRNRNIN